MPIASASKATTLKPTFDDNNNSKNTDHFLSALREPVYC